MWWPNLTAPAFNYVFLPLPPLETRKPTLGGGELSSQDLITSLSTLHNSPLFLELCLTPLFLGVLILQDSWKADPLLQSAAASEVS